MTLFKSRVGKVIFAQITGGLSVIIPKKFKPEVCFLNKWVSGRVILFCRQCFSGG